MRISAVIPTYNHARYVGQAIESVLAQTHPVEEVIVVDDGSTDDTRVVVEGFGERVRYIYQRNAGLSAARNRGITEAQSDWVAFLDADDCWLPTKIGAQVEALRRQPDAVLVYTGYLAKQPDGATCEVEATELRELWPQLRFQNCVSGSGSAVLVRRDVVRAAGGFDESLKACEDWDLWLRLARSHRFAPVREPQAVIRVSASSMSNDPTRMLQNMERILEGTLLSGLSGWRRWAWRRRIRGAQLFKAANMVAGRDPGRERALLWDSVKQWPAPTFLPARYAALCRLLLGRRYYGALRAGWPRRNG